MEAAQKIFTTETLREAAKQSLRCLVVPVRLRRAIKKYLREQDEPHMKKKVLRLSESFNDIKVSNLQLASTTAKQLVDDPMKSLTEKRWKIQSAYGDCGLEYRDDETAAYVASRMPAVFSACHRVLKEVRRRLPGFAPSRVLDFGAGTGSAFWALQEVWPESMKKLNLVEPSQSMQRAGRSLVQGLKNLPLIHSYSSIQALSKNIGKSERKHDLVIASYVLGEIPSLKDRITIVRQLWDLTEDVLVLVEPGTPQGANIISQMRSHILWMEKRKLRKLEKQMSKTEGCKDLLDLKTGAFIVAPCPHDGRCPLEKSEKYCHFVQRLQRTSSQRSYKRSKGQPLRGFEDEKFCFVVFRRGQRPRGPWPLDGMKLETFKEKLAKRNPEDLEVDYEDFIKSQTIEVPYKHIDPSTYDSDLVESDAPDDAEDDQKEEGEEEEEELEEEEGEEEGEEQRPSAGVGAGWGRIIYPPVRRGKQVQLDVCFPTNDEATEGSFERRVYTKSKNPDLHFQAKRSFWGDLWPCQSNKDKGETQ